MGRHRISEETIEEIDEWMEEHPEKGITEYNKAIEYLVDKGIRADEKAFTEKEITERLEKLEEKIDD